jgi:hypothetical protein
MAIIASAIFGRSAFTFGRMRIIRFISSEERCPLNMIYKHALGTEGETGQTLCCNLNLPLSLSTLLGFDLEQA